MTMDVRDTALMVYLQSKDGAYHAKALELRDVIAGWLAYIPQTFPNYTLHTVSHSDEIIRQLSALLFDDDAPDRQQVHLSAAEAYILVAAAYLHDAGMVASDQEKVEILASEEWRAWTAEGPAAKRWGQIAEFRGGAAPEQATLYDFLTDVQRRYLLAEFIRRHHHRRSARLALHSEAALGRYAMGNPILTRTVSDVCLSHGLAAHELEDSERYPERRDIRGETVNVRFMALLLRLGDLLDMDHDRACPLLLSAACPLPPDSLPHWTQYQRITHRLTKPDRIEITAECQSQAEHRILRDWCQWLADEARNAETMMARAQRHGAWKAPLVTLKGPAASVSIRPAPGANYMPLEWRLELDADIVLERLVHDVSPDPAAFLRELIQNALDATRCQMYSDLVAAGIEAPAYPTQVDQEVRERYPLKISLGTQCVLNEMSGEKELRQVLAVDDSGIGMDSDIIQRYFLQVGRSYYATDEFRRSYGFVPTSRFGLGFLSVFSAGDRVTVDTYKPQSAGQDEALRLVLTGPRNYLLIERGSRRQHGTRIELLLRQSMAQGGLTALVARWCRRVEFPIIVSDLSVETTIRAERRDEFVAEVPHVTEPDTKLVIRSFPIEIPGIEGEIYVLAKVDPVGESWTAWRWARSEYEDSHPHAVVPKLPGDLICLHGITVHPGSPHRDGPSCARIDLRGAGHEVALARNQLRPGRSGPARWQAELSQRQDDLLTQHLQSSPFCSGESQWLYKQRLVGHFGSQEFWRRVPGTIPLYVRGLPQLVSLGEVEQMPVLTTLLRQWWGSVFGMRLPGGSGALDQQSGPPQSTPAPALLHADLQRLSDDHQTAIFQDRTPSNVRWLDDRTLAIDWEQAAGAQSTLPTSPSHPWHLVSLPTENTIAYGIHKTTDRYVDCVLLNQDHRFVQWLLRLSDACQRREHGLAPHQIARLLSMVLNAAAYPIMDVDRLEQHLAGWRQLPGLPSDLYPPEETRTRAEFTLAKGQA